ncbi:hypothetical protein NDU88_009639 [Pleurodeles waltl]|uniref:Uncharacterized protein n=1 Tax=Pleurodeles waltl TaxID=8319 RepID=A0AAV7PSQ1_PLEWA|nr:hypothetical protein NDU88_009639 [Pleurodeles waltl]
MAAQTAPSCPTSLPALLPPMETTDHILQEIAAVGRRLEVMDKKISDLMVASTSIRADIAGFPETVTNLDQRLSIVEDRVTCCLTRRQSSDRSMRRSLIWWIGVAETTSAFLAFRNTRRAPILKLFSKIHYPRSQVWFFTSTGVPTSPYDCLTT